MTTALLTHIDCLNHVAPPGHPEQVARLEHILKALDAPEFSDLHRLEAPMGAEEHILLAHPENHLSRIKAAGPTDGYRAIDGDTHMSPGTLAAAFRAIGANTKAVDMVLSGAVNNAFCAIRPPGHHAEKTTAMGFCFFGNVAIAAKHALENHGLSRVAILDFDVHHGNGTQDLVRDDERILFASSHQMPLYPGSGAIHETGAFGKIVNAPLEPMSDGRQFRKVWENRIFPAVEAHEPELTLISAGFDAHRADPLANLNLSTEDFTWVTKRICALADKYGNGRVVSTLEGGYDLAALAAATAAHVKVLMEQGR